jgi:hypothetical protein
MLTHPECKKNEIFVGNFFVPLDHRLKKLTTARLGIVAYDIHKKEITELYYVNLKPLFVEKSEYNEYNRIMMDRMKRK